MKKKKGKKSNQIRRGAMHGPGKKNENMNERWGAKNRL